MIRPKRAQQPVETDEEFQARQTEAIKNEERKLLALQHLRKTEGWSLMQQWFDRSIEALEQQLTAANDVVPLARAAGALSAFKDVRSRVDLEIEAVSTFLTEEVVK
jgi:hypothetical protein